MNITPSYNSFFSYSPDSCFTINRSTYEVILVHWIEFNASHWKFIITKIKNICSCRRNSVQRDSDTVIRHIRIIPSSPPVAKNLPSGLNFIVQIVPLCPLISWTLFLAQIPPWDCHGSSIYYFL